MSDQIKHECGIVLLRLKKPLHYYSEKYGTQFYGLNKMYLLMEKMHNRGQDGAGLANIKIDVAPGQRYISRKRSIGRQAIQDIFGEITKRFSEEQQKNPQNFKDVYALKDHYPYTGELFLGHLRYGTFGGNTIEQCHPFLRQNNWMTRNLVVAGNFNMTNVEELFGLLVDLGQHPKEMADTVTVMEKIGHFLDEANQELFDQYNKQGYSNKQISELIAKQLDVQKVLQRSAKEWDGGYAMVGLFGHGDAFVLRDPSGIRPAYYYEDEEVAVVTSERPPIQTAFNAPLEKIHELEPGHAFIIKKNGVSAIKKVREPMEKMSCSFERIYFSRGNDKDIYQERQNLGKNVVPQVLEAVGHDLDHTVFSFIPNTAETAFYGMIKALEDVQNDRKIAEIASLVNPTSAQIETIIRKRARIEKMAVKDVKMRTFITEDSARDEMVAHVYDVTHGCVRPGMDNLVLIDDSIVRGTTLKKSIIKILDRLGAKKIVIASSAPQIRYPDCYGIDMARMGDFIAFQAAVQLLKERGKSDLLQVIYKKCQDQENAPKETVRNYVREVYEPFTANEISRKISELVTPADCQSKVEVVFQTIEGLHHACPNHKGDWYFTGNYPTPGGNKVVNRAFMNYIEGKTARAY